MKKKGLAISAVAASLAAAAVFAGGDCQTVRAADVADKSAISIDVEGDYEEKSLSKADREAIANQLGYEYFSGDVAVCGSNTTAYVDWENSSIPYWKAYDSYVIVPVLSKRRVSISPAVSTAFPDLVITFALRALSIPAIPIAESKPPIVVGIRQTNNDKKDAIVITVPV